MGLAAKLSQVHFGFKLQANVEKDHPTMAFSQTQRSFWRQGPFTTVNLPVLCCGHFGQLTPLFQPMEQTKKSIQQQQRLPFILFGTSP